MSYENKGDEYDDGYVDEYENNDYEAYAIAQYSSYEQNNYTVKKDMDYENPEVSSEEYVDPEKEKKAIRRRLEKALLRFVRDRNKTAKANELYKDTVGVTYAQAKKFIKQKKKIGQYNTDSVKENKGKIVKAKVEPKAEKKEEKKDEKPPVKVEVDPFDNISDHSDSQEEKQEPEQKTTVVVPKPKPKKEKPKAPKPEFVTRKSMKSMSASEKNRFFDAVDTMMKNKNGPGTSEFFRLASYHGQPGPIYCQHGKETFPGWHRIYLLQFELALQQADKDNNNDGKIGLPYWDWIKNQDLPPMIRTRFKEWPKDLFPAGVKPPTGLTRRTDTAIRSRIQRRRIDQAAYDCLLATEHKEHASTGDQGTNYPSIETSHNQMHVAVGGVMSSVAWAAFDIAFWLHHNNVDRVYESYLKTEPDSKEEFEENQNDEEVDLFEQAFTPFKKPSGAWYMPADTFKTKALGYVYDDLINPPPNQLREAPTLVIFQQIQVHKFESKCYELHVFVVDKSKAGEFKEPASVDELDLDSVNYAGGDSIFGRGMECENCRARKPYDLRIDISTTLRNIGGVSRSNIDLKVYVEEMSSDSANGVLKQVADTELPKPTLVGPLFENLSSETLDKNDSIGGKNNSYEVMSLQNYLNKFGYLDGDTDGKFGDKTSQAVKDFQKSLGLNPDGVAGPKTKNAMVNTKRCKNLDPFAQNDVKDGNVKPDPNAYGKTFITYSIAKSPGYLNRERVEETIAASFAMWSSVCKVNFDFLDDDEPGYKDADIKLRWTAGETVDKQIGFSGPGGVLGHGGHGFVDFDQAERWVYGYGDADAVGNSKNVSVLSDPSTWHHGAPTVSLFYVATHEIGHALGLDHSRRITSLMGPYYSPHIKNLAPEDKSRIRKIYGR